MLKTLGSGVLAQFWRLLSRPSVFPSLCFGSGASLNFLSLMALKSLSKVLSFQAKESPTGGILCPGASVEAYGARYCYIEIFNIQSLYLQIFSFSWGCCFRSWSVWNPFYRAKVRAGSCNVMTCTGTLSCLSSPRCPSWGQILERSRVITSCDVLSAGPLGCKAIIC